MEKQRGMAFGFRTTATDVKNTGWMDGWTDGRTDGRSGGRADRWMDCTEKVLDPPSTKNAQYEYSKS
jgi:hypothetical protein